MSRASPAIKPFRFTDLEAVRRLVTEMQDYERAIDGRLTPGAEMSRASYGLPCWRRTASRRASIEMRDSVRTS